MKVYRLCKEDEYIKIISNKNFKSIGKKFQNNSKLNNHIYEEDKLYIHFFKNFDSIFYLNTNKNKYICIYSIPDKLLEKYKGTGFYLDRENFRNLENVDEYFIENSKKKFNYLDKIYKINNYIDYLDIFDQTFINNIECIFPKEETEEEKIKTLKL